MLRKNHGKDKERTRENVQIYYYLDDNKEKLKLYYEKNKDRLKGKHKIV